mmetsp:Transcript_4029/g.5292  ORF Transcript_4029/g.5292 Transcript_4029/m.5292 type:complete len:135 (-) Transcript_4029:375-779(-)|eukprot:CAMPEP_0198136622 /NCGR_PEP_ID=MMETSP1443-20131203/265_1 /TAXON_ID=186043 /ORGANISM="Entomoneis sp., Strain CCMP2396" /LENGTH=134 /DNA_ID=CAMNT_0043797879 /DNA_START=26 /DNA_END=430 /DNA_ORIENTATION=+
MSNNNNDNTMTALFQNDKDDEEAAGCFRDKIRCLHEHFDKDEDGYLKLSELAALQKATEGVILTEEMYLMACSALNCPPSTGISLNALKLTYASDGADFEKDYYKVFPKKEEKKEEKEEDRIYEVGDDGVDIST